MHSCWLAGPQDYMDMWTPESTFYWTEQPRCRPGFIGFRGLGFIGFGANRAWCLGFRANEFFVVYGFRRFGSGFGTVRLWAYGVLGSRSMVEGTHSLLWYCNRNTRRPQDVERGTPTLEFATHAFLHIPRRVSPSFCPRTCLTACTHTSRRAWPGWQGHFGMHWGAVSRVFAWDSRLWQRGHGGVLADEMGLGKTIQAASSGRAEYVFLSTTVLQRSARS